jgi:hypothetical protein
MIERHEAHHVFPFVPKIVSLCISHRKLDFLFACRKEMVGVSDRFECMPITPSSALRHRFLALFRGLLF